MQELAADGARPGTPTVSRAPAVTGVGVVGLGVMGAAIAERLVRQGCQVNVMDVRREAVEELVSAGAVGHATPREVAAAGDVIVLSLNSAEVVHAVAFGPDGLADGAAPGTVIVDMSSIAPDATRSLAALAAEHGLHWIDAPLSGGAPGARAGRLTLMVGGEENAVRVARARVLDHLAERITHLGPAGSGQVTKLINQILVGVGMAALAEAAALSLAAGLDADVVLAALRGGRAESALLAEFFTKFAARDYTPTGRVANMVKDLDTACAFARTAGIPLPTTATVAELNRWLTAQGHGDADNAVLMEYFGAVEPKPAG